MTSEQLDNEIMYHMSIAPFIKLFNEGVITIVPEEAETVRYIFNLYLQGYGVQTISNILEAENRSTNKSFHSTIKLYSVFKNYEPKSNPAVFQVLLSHLFRSFHSSVFKPANCHAV